MKTGLILKGLQVNFEGALTLLTYSGLKAQDSDWTDETLPDQKTIFSDAEARPRGWTFDASFGFDLPFSDRIRWIVGYRAQQFMFTYTDMYQSELYRPSSRRSRSLHRFSSFPVCCMASIRLTSGVTSVSITQMPCPSVDI